ncbi:MAG: ROK family protein [Elusimicrobiota bacterium]
MTDANASTLVVDIGGNQIKILAPGYKKPLKIPSGPSLNPKKLARGVRGALHGLSFDRVSIGFPGPVVDGRLVGEPVNLAPGWLGFDFRKEFGRPVRLINDAAMQALGSYNGGRMLFLGLGTGLGSALIINGVLQPLELGQMPYKKGKSYEGYLGRRGLAQLGKKKWRQEVWKVVKLLKSGLQVDDVVLGGGNSKKLKELPPGARLGDNANAFVGGLRLWDRAA